MISSALPATLLVPTVTSTGEFSTGLLKPIPCRNWPTLKRFEFFQIFFSYSEEKQCLYDTNSCAKECWHEQCRTRYVVSLLQNSQTLHFTICILICVQVGVCWGYGGRAKWQNVKEYISQAKSHWNRKRHRSSGCLSLPNPISRDRDWTCMGALFRWLAIWEDGGFIP